jgi:REP element-mobilizing transposase RayT
VRVEFAGAVYHVMSRGQELGAIFRDDTDRERFLGTLTRVGDARHWLVHAYCLMTNHYHLLIETPEPNLCAGMRDLNGLYGQAFNYRHGRKGHVFEDRYKAIVVDKEAYLLELSRYIVLNPVRAGMTRTAREYRWSNYRATVGEAKQPDFLEVRWTLEQFGKRAGAAREAYRRFVAEGRISASPMPDVTAQVFLGGPAFLAKMRTLLDGMEVGDAVPRAQRRAGFVDFDRVIAAVADGWRVGCEELRTSWSRRDTEARAVAIHLARRLTGLSGVELGRRFGMSAARVGQLAKRAEESAVPKVTKRMREIEQRLRGLD